MQEMVLKTRSYRRFYEEPIPVETLEQLVDLGRLSGSGFNRQPLKYVISSDKTMNEAIFPTLLWAAYIKDWDGPEPGERPSGYIILLQDKELGAPGVDHGISSQSIMLGATDLGLGGCMIANFHRDKLKEVLALPDRYEILLVLALGKPRETVVIDEMQPEGDVKYWRDENQVHHVPKRSRTEVLLKAYC